jgi:hypothetical protein
MRSSGMAGLVSALLVVLLCSDAAHGRVWAPYSYRSRYGGNFRAAWTTDQIGFPSVAELKSFLQKWEPELAKGTITPDRVAIFSDSVAQALAPLMSLPMDKLQELVEKGNEIAGKVHFMMTKRSQLDKDNRKKKPSRTILAR